MGTRVARVGLLVYVVLLLSVLLNPSAGVASTSVSWLAELADGPGCPPR